MVTEADWPGAIVPEVHEPSRALIVCATFEVLVNVTATPAFVRLLAGEIDHGFDHASSRFALRMLLTFSTPSLIAETSSMRPSHSSVIGSGAGAGRSAIVPPSLNAHTWRFITNAMCCSPLAS